MDIIVPYSVLIPKLTQSPEGVKMVVFIILFFHIIARND